MCRACLPISSVIAIACLVIGFLFHETELYLLFWIAIGLLIIVLAAAFTKYSRIQPKYDLNYVTSADPEIKLEATNKFESKFVQLSNGKTFVNRWILPPDDDDDEKGNEDAPRHDMVLVHGIIQTSEWNAVIKHVCKMQDASENNKVSSIITYHLYGRGYSDAPRIPHTLPLFTQQLSELLMVINVHKPIILVGLSMGGAVSMGFAATFPSKIHKLALLAPAGLPVHKPITAHLATLPVLGEILMPILAKSEAINAMKSEFVEEKEDTQLSTLIHNNHSQAAIKKGEAKSEMDRYENEINRWFRFHKKGSNYSLLSTLRYFPLGEMQNEYFQKLHDDPNFDNDNWIFIWGENDTTAPFQNTQLFKDIKLLKVENANHMDIVAHYGVSKWFDAFWNWL